MKKIYKLLPILVITILIFTPCYANATEETAGSENNQNQENSTPTENEDEESNTSGDPVQPSPSPEIKSISLNEFKITLDPNKTFNLIATVTPSNLTVVWESSDSNVATVDENGKVTAGKNSGSTIITATIKDTEIKAECRVEVNASSDATLKSLTISNGTLDKSFKSDTVEYNVTVESTVNALVFASLQNDLNNQKAGYMVTGNNNLKNGDTVSILVTAEDEKTTKTYKLTIVKDTVNLNLKSLKINGYALNEVFNPNTLEYTANIPYEIETISVQAAAEDSDAQVKVSGLTNLKIGENTVTVTVKDDSNNSRVYKIVVTREEETTIEENPTSIITSNNTNKNSSAANNGAVISNDGNSDNFLKYAIVSLACLILFVIGGIGIYFYLKTSPKKLKKELKSMKQEEKVSPIIEVGNENKNQIKMEELMREELVKTKEFTNEELEEIVKTENLFDDEEDV